jgi:hypothetical protein
MLGDDLRDAPRDGRVIYLEGKTDPEMFFALLGLSRAPRDGIHQDVLIKGLSEKRGSGTEFVRQCIARAEKEPSYAGRFIGIIDGDGIAQPGCGNAFDPADRGPLLAWPVYCIENLLAQAGWPPDWGPAPDWPEVLLRYAPYVATNRLVRDAQGALKKLEIDHFISPSEPLKSVDGVLSVLQEHRDLLRDLGDVADRFRAHVEEFRRALDRSMEEAHVHLNGKWLLKHLAPTRTRLVPERCRKDWLAHVAAIGGHPPVRALWRRITGQDP